MKRDTFFLGIETSCDETSVAVIKNGREVLSCEIATSIPLHQETKGVVPEVAARAQIEAMIPVVDRSLKNAGITLQQIDKIAVTQGPGLIGSLLVGISTANTISISTGIPVVGVPHIWGHMYANMLDNEQEIEFPALVLTVSGGHNDLYLWKDHGNFEKLGGTLDDAAGEAFDKCGRLLDLPYPAGPHVSKLAEQGNAKAFNFPRSMLQSGDYNFSFSGLKTAFLYKTEKLQKNSPKKSFLEIEGLKEDLAASLQEAICETLWKKVKKAIEQYNPKEIHLSGGVSANKRLREIFSQNLTHSPLSKGAMGILLRYPKNLVYCTDNAAMIACCAYFCNLKEGFLKPDLRLR